LNRGPLSWRTPWRVSAPTFAGETGAEVLSPGLELYSQVRRIGSSVKTAQASAAEKKPEKIRGQ
jgi:hypothetical protein